MIATLAAAGGCAITPVASVAEFASRNGANSFEAFGRLPNSEALVLEVPFDRQDNRIACGAHVLGSVIRYWRPEATATGKTIFAARPPADSSAGYSMQELVLIARQYGLEAYGVRITQADLVAELEKGRPVLVPVRLPYVYEQSASLFDPDPAVISQLKAWSLGVVGSASEMTGAGMLAHYVLVVGHAKERFVLLDPVIGYRTIAKTRLDRYRKVYGDASLMFSPSPVT